MQIALPELTSPATLILDRENGLSDEQYAAFCEANPELRVERTSTGEIIIVPPAGAESDYRSLEVASELRNWAKKDGRGKAFGPTVAFLLPNGAARCPDAAWVSNQRLWALSRKERQLFPAVVPEFVVEVRSPSDRLPAAQEKMREWIANGVDLAWLIDGDARTVHVYRAGGEVQSIMGTDSLAGEGPVAGFILDLTDIWEGL